MSEYMSFLSFGHFVKIQKHSWLDEHYIGILINAYVSFSSLIESFSCYSLVFSIYIFTFFQNPKESQ